MSDLVAAIVGQVAAYLILGFIALQLIPLRVDEWDEWIARVTRFGRKRGSHVAR